MADVLCPIIPQNQPVPLLQPRPSSADTFQAAMSGQQSPSRINQIPRSHFNNHVGAVGYRGTAAVPVAPYAYKSTPQLKNEPRITATIPAPSQPLASESASAGNRQRYPAPDSVSTTSSSNSSNPTHWSQQFFAKDDSILTSKLELAPFTALLPDITDSAVSINENLLPPSKSLSKATPDRYRRNRRSETTNSTWNPQLTSKPNGVLVHTASSVAKTAQVVRSPEPIQILSSKITPDFSNDEPLRDTTVEDANCSHKLEAAEEPHPPSSIQRYRRRSSRGNIQAGTETETVSSYGARQIPPSDTAHGAFTPAGAQSNLHGHTVKHDIRPVSAAGPFHRGSPSTAADNVPPPVKSYADAVRRMNNPPPSSQPAPVGGLGFSTSSNPATMPPPLTPHLTVSQSPAVAAMAALNEKDPGKGVKSRLRRAFSFGSSAEFRRAAGESDNAVDRARVRQAQFSNGLDEEQDEIIRQQEASGLGNSIYSGQGNVFVGSTDNLSISSTASSASMMLRKMGQGLKKGGRNMKGLFRPKSVIGVPAADGPIQASVGGITLVTIEAEREKVNINVDPHDQPGGGTGFPKLERNSVDAARASVPVPADSRTVGSLSGSRSTIGGGVIERAEVLAGIKRGILKRASTVTPTISLGTKSMESHYNHGPSAVASAVKRGGSPSPSTTSTESRRNGHRRTGSATVEGDDYFGGVPRLGVHGTSRSLPVTPRGLSRNISFSPRLQFHDVWSSTEYDRRGDIATCNRLTPMLAQQIKEELNSFKMEMEVHELSKPHTHFF